MGRRGHRYPFVRVWKGGGSMTDNKQDTYTANVRIENFPRDVDIKLNAIATKLQVPKKEVIKLALVEFVEHHG
jgi:hypothetical protein